jgi:hypothetical protein
MEQRFGTDENIGDLSPSYMFAIPFAGFIVETQNTISFDNQSKPILEPVRTSRKWSRQAPHDHFDESFFSKDTALIKQ